MFFQKSSSFWLIRLKGIQDCSIRQSREQASFISDIFLGLHLWRISLIYLLASLWVRAWSWSPGMEAPSVGRRLLHIPIFHQRIRRVSLFLIDFSSPHLSSLSFPPYVFPSFSSVSIYWLQTSPTHISQLCASQAVPFPCWIKERVKAPHMFLLQTCPKFNTGTFLVCSSLIY